MSIQREPRGAWILLVGPGEHVTRLPSLLRGFPAGAEPGSPNPIRALEDLGELFCDFPHSGRIVLDADALRNEDVGLVRAFLERRPGFQLELVGGDPGSLPLRRLARLERVRQWSVPLDLDALDAFLRAPGSPAAAAWEPEPPRLDPAPDPRPQVSTPDPAPRGERRAPVAARHEELALGGPGVPVEVRAEVERILGAGRMSEPTERPAPPPEPPSAPAPAPHPEGAAVGPRPPAPYFRDQVSDLADFAQRLELSAGQVREEAFELVEELQPGAGDALVGRLDTLHAELVRLLLFVRTLGFVASPPAAGAQRIDLGGLLRELLAAPQLGGGPKLETALEEPLWVRADKEKLSQALDALVVLATRCAGPEGTVRARGRRVAETDSVRVELAFPAGPIAGVALEQLFEPYALRRLVPDLGSNALAAAAGIAQGQGGSLQVAPGRAGRLRVALVLPADRA